MLPRLNNNASEGDCSGPRESRTCSTQFGVLAQEGGQAVFYDFGGPGVAAPRQSCF